jgi:hypothetical protein
MNITDTAPSYALAWGACAALACLFLVSTVILVIVLVRRSRKGRDGVA